MLKVMVCGPIGRTGIGKIKSMSDFLARNGFEMTNQFELKMMDYSDVLDFRTKKKLSRSIVRHDLRLVRECDVMVVLATPSFGAAMEMFFAKNLGKRTVLLSDGPIPSPWPVNFADFIVNDKDSLLRILRRIKGKA